MKKRDFNHSKLHRRWFLKEMEVPISLFFSLILNDKTIIRRSGK